MREPIDALLCDETDCGQEISGPARWLVERARAAGWQAREATNLTIFDTGPQVSWTDRCPNHHTEVVDREVLRAHHIHT